MVIDYNRTAAYVCPFCSAISEHPLNVFDFSGGQVKLPCSARGCGEHCVTIVPRGKKYRIDAECPVCMETHSFYVPSEKLWAARALACSCPESGIGIFFIGEQNAVEQKLRESVEEYNRLFGEYGGDPEDDEHLILDGIADRLNVLLLDRSVKCTCGSRDISLAIRGGFVTAVCKSCGRTMSMPADEHTLMQLMNIKTFVIK